MFRLVRTAGRIAASRPRNAVRRLGMLLLTTLLLQTATAQNPNREYQIKAAYLHKFLIFTEWPPTTFATPTAPFRVCVVGEDPFGATLDATLTHETAQGRSIEVARLADPAEARTCHVAFLGADADVAVPAFLDAVGDAPLLTVSEAAAFAEAGGTIALFTHRNRVRFAINAKAATRAGLRLDPGLLRLAARR